MKNAVQHLADPYLLRDLRRTPKLTVFSDYGGEHDGAEVSTYSFLLLIEESLGRFLLARPALRSGELSDRRMAYKALSDGVRAPALVPFLSAADSIHGVLFTLAVAKNAELFVSGDIEQDSRLLPDFKLPVAKKLVTIRHWLSFAVAGLVGPGQDIA